MKPLTTFTIGNGVLPRGGPRFFHSTPSLLLQRMRGIVLEMSQSQNLVNPGQRRWVFTFHQEPDSNLLKRVTGYEEDQAKRIAITSMLKSKGFLWDPTKKCWANVQGVDFEEVKAFVDAQKNISPAKAEVHSSVLDPKKSPMELRNAERVKQWEVQLKELLPRGVDAPRFFESLRAALNGADRVLANSGEVAIYNACAKCAQLGMTPGPLAECYFSTREGQIEFLLGYKGLIALARRAIPDLQIVANVVREGDQFKYVLGNSPTVELIQNPQADPNALLYAYVVLTYPDGVMNLSVVDKHHIKKRMDCSKGTSSPSSPWVKFAREMWLKTAIREALRFAHLATETTEKQDVVGALKELKTVLRAVLNDEFRDGEPAPNTEETNNK